MTKKERKKLVKDNLKLVEVIAKRYSDRGVPLKTLIKEGKKGLVKASKVYLPFPAYDFPTYSTWFIRRSIFNTLVKEKEKGGK